MALSQVLQTGLGIVQGISGLVGQDKAKDEMDRLLAQRKAFVTPDEVYQMLQATQSNASAGLGSEVLNYLTNQNDRTLSTGVGAATLLGADANLLGSMLDNYNQQSLSIGAQDVSARMANFSRYLQALNTVAANKEAEQISQDNLIKDRIQATSASSANATKNLQSGVNALLGGVAAWEQGQLYQDDLSFLRDLNMVNSVRSTPVVATNTTQSNVPASTNAGQVLSERGITPRITG